MTPPRAINVTTQNCQSDQGMSASDPLKNRWRLHHPNAVMQAWTMTAATQARPLIHAN